TILASTTFDLVILDHFLLDMNGLELLQQMNREGIAQPVLMLTGKGNEKIATSALRAGVCDYIPKDSGLDFLNDLPKRVSESGKRHRLEQPNQLLIQPLDPPRDGVLITDLRGTIIHVNRALEKLSGYDRHELLGQTPRIFKSGVHPPDFYARMWKTVLGRDSW